MRLTIISNVYIFLLALIISALAYMQIIRGDLYHEQSLNNRIRIVPSDAPRGIIYDRNGVVIADNHLSFNVAVIPQDVEDSKALFGFLGRVLKKDPEALRKTYLRKKMTPFEPVTIAEDVDRRTLIYLEENIFSYPGMEVYPHYERFYPFHEAGAHLIGYVGKIDPIEADVFSDYGYTPLTMVGKAGVERMYERFLQGVSGGKQIEVNSRGQQVRLLSTKESIKGQDIQLTVDQRLQSKAASLLVGNRGSIAVMEIASGEVLALVSSPNYDPNVFSSRDLKDRVEGLIKNTSSPLLNRGISGQFPPGSLFKIPVALAALERNKITTDTAFDCPGYYMLGQAKFGCAHVHGRENLLQAIAHSCNVYFFHLGRLVGPSVIGAYAKAFGLGRTTGIDLPFETKGKIVLPEQKKDGWFTGNTLNLSIGQGDTLATPIQVTVMMAAVANDGILIKPRVIKALSKDELALTDLSKRPKIRLRDSSWAQVKKGMRLVVENAEGTGHLLAGINDVDIWGKTGTAQAGRGQPDHAWFAGFLRSAKSNLAFCVFLEHGGSSANAVAITKELLLYMQSLGTI